MVKPVQAANQALSRGQCTCGKGDFMRRIMLLADAGKSGIIVAAAAVTLAGLLVPVSGIAAGAQRPALCSLLTRDEVRRIAPWPAEEDRAPSTALTYSPQADLYCEYPGVEITLNPGVPWDAVVADSRSNGLYGPLERVAGVGEDAYTTSSGTGDFAYAVLLAKAGPNAVSISIHLRNRETVQTAKPRLIALGKALIAKMR
jgi:hypothetical protein